MIVIVDYGLGNLGSVNNMLKRVGVASIISDDKEIINKAKSLILPGVGSFENGMNNLHEKGLKEVLDKKVLQEKTPILGICLGMQLMTKRSEEGNVEGLGWIEADTVKFTVEKGQQHFKVPHMGWNIVNFENEVFSKDMGTNPKFYFVHSYYVKCKSEKNILCSTDYMHSFASGIIKDNIIGVQFHPEKSHKFGMQLLKNITDNFLTNGK